MSLFICAKCGCIDNTATSSYWGLTRLGAKDDYIYDESLKEYKGMPLCSECAKIVFHKDNSTPNVVPGKWHGKFPKELATEEDKKKVRYKGLIY